MSCTPDNLQEAFAGESQANRRYLFFAAKADTEGYPQVARLFRAAADAETVHARNHLEVLGGVGTTIGNLEAAVQGEHFEFTDMYPKFIAHAEEDANQQAIVSFTQANAVEQIHHGLFHQALETLERSKELKEEPYFVCQVCGNTIGGDSPERCPVCGAPKTKFKRVE